MRRPERRRKWKKKELGGAYKGVVSPYIRNWKPSAFVVIEIKEYGRGRIYDLGFAVGGGGGWGVGGGGGAMGRSTIRRVSPGAWGLRHS